MVLGNNSPSTSACFNPRFRAALRRRTPFNAYELIGKTVPHSYQKLFERMIFGDRPTGRAKSASVGGMTSKSRRSVAIARSRIPVFPLFFRRTRRNLCRRLHPESRIRVWEWGVVIIRGIVSRAQRRDGAYTRAHCHLAGAQNGFSERPLGRPSNIHSLHPRQQRKNRPSPTAKTAIPM